MQPAGFIQHWPRWTALSLLAAHALIVPLWATQKTAAEQIHYYQSVLAKDPNHWPSWAGLGAAYLVQARESEESALYAKAEAALKRSLELQPNYDALNYLTAVCVARHRFAEGIRYGLETVKTFPTDTRSYVFLSDAYLAIGDYQDAADLASQMLKIRRDFYALSHDARLRFVRGNVSAAIDEMQQALATASEDELSHSLMPWAEVQLGSYHFSKGDLANAERAYEQALTISPVYSPALEHLAELRAAEGKLAAAAELYERLLARRKSPAWQAALADLLNDMGQRRKANGIRSGAVGALRRAIRSGRVDLYRHLATIYLQQGVRTGEALRLAKKDLTVRQDVYAYDLLAWAQLKTGNCQEAVRNIEKALAWGTQDAQLFFHAGMIYRQAGDRMKSKESLQRALETNPYFNRTEAGIARRLLSQ